MRGVTIGSLDADNFVQCVNSGALDRLLDDVEMKIDINSFTTLWFTLLKARIAAIFLSLEDGIATGAMGAICAPDPNDGVMAVTTGFWVVHPDANMMAGIGLFGAVEKWGKTMKAGKLIMVKCHEAVKDMDGFFIRQGYRQSEVRYTKKL